MIKVGTFAKSVAAAPAVQSIAGLGFEPKALILWSTGLDTLDTYSAHSQIAIGLTDGTTSRSECTAMQDAVGTSNTTRGWTQAALSLYDHTGALQFEAALTTLDADGFTLTFTTNNATASYIHYFAIGGDDLTDVLVLPWTLLAAGGNQAVGGVGFQPDCVIHIGNYRAAYGTVGDTYLSFGAMDAAGNQYAMGIGSRDGQASSKGNQANAPRYCTACGNGALVPLHQWAAEYVSMDAGGFTINQVIPPAVPVYMASLCLKGGSYYVGTIDEKDAPGNQAIADPGFLPEGVLFFSGQWTDTGAGIANDAAMGVGGMDGTSQVAIVIRDSWGSDPMICKRFAETDGCIYVGAIAGVRDEAAYVSMDAAGFTINWSTQTNDLFHYGYIAFDTGPLAPPVPPVATGTFHDILFVTRSVGYIAVEDASGNPEIWRTIDGGYSWHILPDKGGLLPGTITALRKLAPCSHNRIMVAGQTSDAGVLVEFTGD